MLAVLTRAWADGARRNPMAVVMVLAIIVVVVTLGVALAGGGSGDGFRLRSTTMVPTELHDASTLECPPSGSTTPVDYRRGGELAEELPVYAGELVAVRLWVTPYSTNLPDEVSFQARWPTDVVDDSGPVCAFVLGAGDAATAALEWERIGPAAASFTLTDTGDVSSSIVEVWLEASEPTSGARMFTALEVSEPRDDFVIDALGGRITIERRPGGPAVVSLTSDTERVAGSDDVNLVATVTNESPITRSFDVTLSLKGSVDGIVFEASDEHRCDGIDPFVCEIGDLLPGEQVEVPILMQVPASPPMSVACGDAGRAVGVCVAAEATSDISSRRPAATRMSWVLLSRVGSSTGDLSISAQPATIVRRVGESTVARLLVTSNTTGDIASLEVVGSDCADVARTEIEGDGDSFLGPEEIWAFDCTLAPDAPSQFRIDVAGINSAGTRVTATYEGVIELVAPALDFSIETTGTGATTVTITNIGLGSLHEIAVRLPGCTSQGPSDVERLLEGQRLEIECSAGVVIAEQVVAYGLDPGGRPFAIRNG